MNRVPEKIVLAVTGASGTIYARQLAQALLGYGGLRELALIYTDNGRDVATFEDETIPLSDPRITLYDNSDLFAPPASGSADYDAMVVVPCSAGTAGRIACGVSEGLAGRAADVMLKERRRLILVLRETPLSTVHLRNLTTLSECGAVVLPACPSFYTHPQDIEALCLSVTQRIVSLLDIPGSRYRWGDGAQGEGR